MSQMLTENKSETQALVAIKSQNNNNNNNGLAGLKNMFCFNHFEINKLQRDT
jgi:hypothetical protein